MHNNIDMWNLIVKILVSSFAAVGLMEWIKNFVKTEKKWIYSIIMPFISVGCFLACEYLPVGFIGGILTIGCVQLDYQVIIQGFQKVFEKAVDKIDEKK